VSFETIEVKCSETGDRSDLLSVAEVAALHLEAGGLLGHPTLGVYGLGGQRSRACEEAVSRLKGNPVRRGLVYLVFDATSARIEFPGAKWSPAAEKLAEELWPGPLTIVLPDGTPDGIAIRAESHPVTRAVLERWGRAMSSTSLNRTGEPPARTQQEADATLRAMPASETAVLLLKAGDLGDSPPSTLVRPTSASYEVLRHGSVPVAQLEAALS
jgi:L-threonylcarbamoyladenylate synthase